MSIKIEPQQITILCDTREQRPLKFHSSFKVERIGLKTGDYSCKHLESVVTVERKSLNDLIGCIGRDRERFEKNIERLLLFPVRAIIVEANWVEIEQQRYRGSLSPNSAIGSILSWIVRGIPICMAGDPTRTASFTQKIILQAAKNAVRGKYPEHNEAVEKFIESIKRTTEEN